MSKPSKPYVGPTREPDTPNEWPAREARARQQEDWMARGMDMLMKGEVGVLATG